MINKKRGELIVLLFVTRMGSQSDSVGIQVIRLEFLCIVKEKHS